MTTPHGQLPPQQPQWQHQGPPQQRQLWQGPPPQQMPPPQPPRKKHTGLKVAGGIIGGIFVIGILADMDGGSTQTATTGATPTTAASAKPTSTTTRMATPEPAPTAQAPKGTVSQRQAIREAESYLNYGAFSRKGLIKQLEYEKFSTEDATYAVDNITVDWNEQAAKEAKSYLDYSSFSRQGLIDQLKYEGFTTAQAEHGVSAVGL